MSAVFLLALAPLLVPLFFMSGRGGLTAVEKAQLRRVERKLDAVLNHLGVEADDRDGLSSQAKLYADSNQKIAAIKQHRDDTGAGLAEAKTVIDEYLSRGPVRG